jgi:hypothetical protein
MKFFNDDQHISEDAYLAFLEMYLKGKIPYEHFTEAFIVIFVKNFSKYKLMTINRLELGIDLINLAV